MSAITVTDLSADQREAYEAIIRWTRAPGGKPVLALGGYAGTGKSTLVALVAEQLPPPVAFCAFTGKASSILKRKLAAAGVTTVGTQPKPRGGGVSLEERPYCGTIHSLVYRPCECREPKTVVVQRPCPECDTMPPAEVSDAELPALPGHRRCANGHALSMKTFEKIKSKTFHVRAEKGPDGRCTICGDKGWLRRDALDRHYSLIIVDEASMVDDRMLDDLQSYGVPILAVGDHGQLPPVRGTGSLMRRPDLRLERIHRQAEGNPIILLSKIIRETGSIPDRLPAGFDGDDRVVFKTIRQLDGLIEARYYGADPARLLAMGLACATNRRRVGLNVAVRRVRGTARQGRELPRAGEHVVCLRNMKAERGIEPIYNGMRGVCATDLDPKQVKNSRDNTISASEVQLAGSIGFPDDGIEPRAFDILRAQFGREKTYNEAEELARETGIHSFAMAGALFDHGWAMTVHKLQGSSVEDLVGVVERMGPMSNDDYQRWAYTLCTRASHKLVLCR